MRNVWSGNIWKKTRKDEMAVQKKILRGQSECTFYIVCYTF